MSEPRLIETSVPRRAEAVALVLHGGGARRDTMMVSPTQLSVLRMLPMAKRLALAGRGRLAVFRLLNSSRGWDTHRTPVDDAAWALRQIGERLPHLPVALVGHSLGGRAALLAGAEPGVETVVALNPFVFPSDVADLVGRRVLIVHGDHDRIALPSRSATVARRLMATTDVGYVTVPGGGHAMLRHGRVFERAASDFVTATLLGPEGRRPHVEQPVRRVLAGEQWVTA